MRGTGGESNTANGGAGGVAVNTLAHFETVASSLTINGTANGGNGGANNTANSAGAGGSGNFNFLATSSSGSVSLGGTSNGGSGGAANGASSLNGSGGDANTTLQAISSFATGNVAVVANATGGAAGGGAGSGVRGNAQAIAIGNGNAYTAANSTATGGRSAIAQSSANGTSGLSNAVANSNGGIITSESSTTSATVDSVTKTDSRANVGQAIFAQSDAVGQQAAAFASGLPNNSDALAVLSANHVVHQNFNLNSQGFGPASTMLGYSVLGGSYSGFGTTSHTYNSDTQYTINLNALTNQQHLLVGLLDPVSSDAGDITSLQFTIYRQSVTVVSQTFANPTAAALNSFFNDRIIDLGDYSGVGANLNLDIRLSVTTSAAAAAFNTSVIFGNATLLAGPLIGDFNRDGHVDSRDIGAALKAVTNLTGYETTYHVPVDLVSQLVDVNDDGVFNNADVQSLLNLLKNGGGSTSVPEPSTFVLSLIGIGMIRQRKIGSNPIRRSRN